MGQQHPSLKPRMLEDLMRMSDFSADELKIWYNEFYKDSVSGFLSKNDFIKIYKGLFPQGDASGFADHVFRTFDANKDGVLNFREFVIGLSLTMNGPLDDKLYWAFKLYDVDGNGYVTKDEMNEIIAVSNAIFTVCCTDTTDDDVIMSGREAFKTMDTDEDGKVSWGEFRRGIHSNRVLMLIVEAKMNNAGVTSH
ncbi:neurocalcin-delta-like isoform X1 [Ciona intestinalis]